MVTHLPPTSEVYGSNPGHCGKVGSWHFTVQDVYQVYALVSSANKTTCCGFDLYSVENDVKRK